MKDLKEFNIPFVGLKQGSHLFDYHINNRFFEAFSFNELSNANINVTLCFVKKSTLFELDFSVAGTVEVPCDITNELFNQQIEGSLPLIVKFGPEFNDDSEEVLILPHEEYQLNVAQYIYELIVLAIPAKKVHPEVLDGTMENETLKKLKELEYKGRKTVEEETTDPRWDKLKDLLTGKNT